MYAKYRLPLRPKCYTFGQRAMLTFDADCGGGHPELIALAVSYVAAKGRPRIGAKLVIWKIYNRSNVGIP